MSLFVSCQYIFDLFLSNIKSVNCQIYMYMWKFTNRVGLMSSSSDGRKSESESSEGHSSPSLAEKENKIWFLGSFLTPSIPLWHLFILYLTNFKHSSIWQSSKMFPTVYQFNSHFLSQVNCFENIQCSLSFLKVDFKIILLKRSNDWIIFVCSFLKYSCYHTFIILMRRNKPILFSLHNNHKNIYSFCRCYVLRRNN